MVTTYYLLLLSLTLTNVIDAKQQNQPLSHDYLNKSEDHLPKSDDHAYTLADFGHKYDDKLYKSKDKSEDKKQQSVKLLTTSSKARNNLQKLKDFNPSGAGVNNPCSRLQCPRYKVCYLNIQRIPMCRCPNVYACKNAQRKPVCSADNQTYKNHCFLKAEECRQNKRLKIARKGACRDKSSTKNNAEEMFTRSDLYSNYVTHFDLNSDYVKSGMAVKKNGGVKKRSRRVDKRKINN